MLKLTRDGRGRSYLRHLNKQMFNALSLKMDLQQTLKQPVLVRQA